MKNKSEGKERMRATSVRVDANDLQLAKFYNLDLGVLFRKVIREEVSKRQGTCPSCGAKSKWEKVK
jgi:hypothetical protein